MNDDAYNRITFPVQSKVLRRFLIRLHQRCPQCGGFTLDAGNECTVCGFDAMPESKERLSARERLGNLIAGLSTDIGGSPR